MDAFQPPGLKLNSLVDAEPHKTLPPLKAAIARDHRLVF